MRRRVVLAVVLGLGFVAESRADILKALTPKVTINRRIETTEDELRLQLAKTPEVGLDLKAAGELHGLLRASKNTRAVTSPQCGIDHYFNFGNKEEANTLPWKSGEDAAASPEDALKRGTLATRMRSQLRGLPTGKRLESEVKRLRSAFNSKNKNGEFEWLKPEAVSTLVQTLQAEDTTVRELLVDTLASINGKEASVALAQRALFDLSPTVRERAVQALVARQVSIDG